MVDPLLVVTFHHPQKHYKAGVAYSLTPAVLKCELIFY